MGKLAPSVELTDSILLNRLEAYCKDDRNHWSFRKNSTRQHGHAYFQYPAMMVPQMVGDLLTAIVTKNPAYRHAYDPFAGSGTALTEAMMRGLDFTGRDINPLAVLLCQAKTIPFFNVALTTKLTEINRAAQADKKLTIAVDFPNRTKWFKASVAIELSKLRRAIQAEGSLWARRFFWVALAETVRLTSNSRTSTFKLHIRPAAEIAARDLSPISIFQKIAERNIGHLRLQKESLEKAKFAERGHYCGNIDIRLGDSAEAKKSSDPKQKFDMLVTSPPYGDNATTVPYGQHSYLPLQWIELGDIDPNIDKTCLSTTHEIDRRSLGGSRRGVKTVTDDLRQRSPALSATIDALACQKPDRVRRVIAFCRDLHRCIAPASAVMRPNAVMIWILGNRKVGGNSVPLDRILSDFLVADGSRHITIIKRDIPSKRMAVRNNVSGTMRTENIVVLRKGAD